MKISANFIGEFIGTFILVFFGCGAVAVTVLFNSHVELFSVAVIWGLAVILAIYTVRHICCAHLNPAVSIAMVVGKYMPVKKLPIYLMAQFSGAFFASMLLYLLFSSSIEHFESINGILRGTPASIKTAMMFGEFYPNPGTNIVASVSTINAFLAETLGTFVLVFFIFSFTQGCNVGRPDNKIAPVFIGLTVTIIICVIAPLTQAGLNPARDLAPRIFSYLAGWKDAAFSDNHFGVLAVYVLGPITGGILASLFFKKIIHPAMGKTSCNHEKY